MIGAATHGNWPLFAASRIKILRAKQFIAELKTEIERYKADSPLTAWLDTSNEPPSVGLKIKPVGLWPGAVLGDAIHNLRTALDLMASEMARLNGKSDKNVYFPFADKKENLDEAIRKKSFHFAGADAVALLWTFQPYKGGNIALRAIHDLDVRDKHSMIIATPHLPTIAIEASYNIDDPNNTASVKADIQELKVIFPADSPFFEREVIETLESLVELVEGVLEAFAGLIAARAKP